MAAFQNVMEAAVEGAAAVSEPGTRVKITCDQAVFTSVRTPTGEGYRIIAASRGLTAEEKRAITRNAPSHNGLCDQSAGGRAMAFYPLPTGRLCAACSCCAGSEHTGRGGQRVYTFNVVFAVDRFPAIRFNPFHVFRAIQAAGHGKPRLDLPAELDALELDVSIREMSRKSASGQGAVDAIGSPAHRRRALHCLTSERPLVISMQKDAPSCVEALILAVPGPARAALSFSEGVRFSVGRCYRLNLISGDAQAARNRAAGQSVEFLDPAKPLPDDEPASDWFRFVDGHWQAGTLDQLDLRTSASVDNAGGVALEHTAEVYLAIDRVDQFDFYELLAVAGECLGQGQPDSARAELLERIQPRLVKKWDVLTGSDIEAYWARAVRLWRESDAAVLFMQPVLDRGLEITCQADPWTAARRVLEIGRDFPLSAWRAGLRQTIQKVLECWADAWQNDPDRPHSDTTGLLLLNQWRMLRPKCTIIGRLTEYVSQPPKGKVNHNRRATDPKPPPDHNRRATDPKPPPDKRPAPDPN
jgi:hypothetical protein